LPFKLSDPAPVVAYSESERKLFTLLGSKPKTTTKLVESFYKDKKRPFFDQTAFRATISTFIRKVDANEEDFVVVKSPRRGPQPSTYALAQRKAPAAKPRRASA
jgi:hypothetical protein